MSRLSDEKRRLRTRLGCDADIPEGGQVWYAIRCPRCDGAAASGLPCDLCTAGDVPGFRVMRRCPASFMSPDLTTALTALKWTREGFLPGDGGFADQTISYIEFRRLFEAEINEASDEQRREGS